MSVKNLSTRILFIATACVLCGSVLSCSKKSTNQPDNAGPAVGMKLIPAKNQTFNMGGSDPLGYGLPIHSVTFTYDFWMDETEITMREYADLMGSRPQAPDSVSGDMFPAINVNWYQAIMFCNARSKHFGFDTVYAWDSMLATGLNSPELFNLRWYADKKGFRLPTEAEWEFACRAGTTTSFFWGDDTSYSVVGRYAWCKINTWATTFEDGIPSGLIAVREVAQKIPNGFGLYDMTGNVWEWCFEVVGYYMAGETTDPINFQAPSSSQVRTLRGGSWIDWYLYNLKSFYRWGISPVGKADFAGFRTVLNTDMPKSWTGRIER